MKHPSQKTQTARKTPSGSASASVCSLLATCKGFLEGDFVFLVLLFQNRCDTQGFRLCEAEGGELQKQPCAASQHEFRAFVCQCC